VAPPKTRRNQRLSPGHWTNPHKTFEHMAIANTIRTLQQDKLIMTGRPVILWMPVGELQVGATAGGGVGGNVGAIRCTCVASAAVRADRVCVQCYGTGYAPGYLRFGHDTISALAAHAAASADGYGGEAWTLVDTALDTSIRPWRFALTGSALTGTITTTDRAFTVVGGAAEVTEASGGAWEYRLEYATRDAGAVTAEYSIDAGTSWRPIADIVSAAPPTTSGNIRFRFTLTRPSADDDGPVLDGIRVRRAVTSRVNPFIAQSRDDYTPGRILILRTFVNQQFASSVYGGQTALHNGDRGWCAPLDFYDVSIPEDTPACRVPDGQVGPHAFYQHSEGVFADRRYAVTGIQYSTEVGAGRLTSQSWEDRLVTPSEGMWLVW